MKPRAVTQPERPEDRPPQEGLQSSRPWRCPRCGLFDAALLRDPQPSGELALEHAGCFTRVLRAGGGR